MTKDGIDLGVLDRGVAEHRADGVTEAVENGFLPYVELRFVAAELAVGAAGAESWE